ncbi:hypothetical protein BN1723_004264 [Verticillium longisporum]|uniref:protein-ribulosamine 3-kinase n=1 Tax=Verticillium longisporum TaxID=100787 RepID=A0A0G4MLV2_VERLO|nr:hypothetical protein BN1708_006660 [Verticillium longisporum]CRK37202.1 hypothetical protein BN1723_004264 [Verticillium longisporum]
MTEQIFELDRNGRIKLDTQVKKCLPEGERFIEATAWGASAWTQTARIKTRLRNGTHNTYFLKCTTDPTVMMEGEFNSTTAMHNLVPDFVPKPYGWGRFLSTPRVYFFIMEFLNMRPTMPNPVVFCHLIAEVHQKSVSPNGMFGFPVPTCQRRIIQGNVWTSSWRECYDALITEAYDEAMKINGPWAEFEAAFATLRRYVIPALLDPLQSHGRILKPCLVHGDLWEENAGVNIDTQQPVVFDPSCMYAHNEYDLGMWRREVIRFGQPYFRQYLMRMPPSEPASQWDDRNRLYSIKFNLTHSAHYLGSPAREDVYKDMGILINKYGRSDIEMGVETGRVVQALWWCIDMNIVGPSVADEVLCNVALLNGCVM